MCKNLYGILKKVTYKCTEMLNPKKCQGNLDSTKMFHTRTLFHAKTF